MLLIVTTTLYCLQTTITYLEDHTGQVTNERVDYRVLELFKNKQQQFEAEKLVNTLLLYMS